MKIARVDVGPLLVQHPALMMAALRGYGLTRGCLVTTDRDRISIRKGRRRIILRRSHAPYCRDIIEEFGSYADAVASSPAVLDFSSESEVCLAGWDLFPVLLPGLPEPMSTISQYIELTGMQPGDHVLDLGAYAGISAMAFQEHVGASGRVVAVEADPANAACARANLLRYSEVRDAAPVLIEAAVWWGSESVEFTAEGSLGSAVTEVLPRAQGISLSMPTVTLSEVMTGTALGRVDVIKADIEGAEYMAFSDSAFFAEHHPVIVFEPAGSSVRETQLETLTRLLTGYGYAVEVFPQAGSRLPLAVCR